MNKLLKMFLGVYTSVLALFARPSAVATTTAPVPTPAPQVRLYLQSGQVYLQNLTPQPIKLGAVAIKFRLTYPKPLPQVVLTAQDFTIHKAVPDPTSQTVNIELGRVYLQGLELKAQESLILTTFQPSTYTAVSFDQQITKIGTTTNQELAISY